MRSRLASYQAIRWSMNSASSGGGRMWAKNRMKRKSDDRRSSAGAFVLRLRAAGQQAVLAQPGERRIDRPETGRLNVGEGPLLEALFDLVAARVAARQHAEAKCPGIHGWSSPRFM
jgi:hypothetical protein